MNTILKMPDDEFQRVHAHLIRPNADREQAAFLLVKRSDDSSLIAFNFLEAILLSSSDFASQWDDYIELTDEARLGLIKRAHALGASLVEIHSHLGPWPARFSEADRRGFVDTIPHMFLRLHGRPYVAMVFTETAFDALVWLDSPDRPVPLAGLWTGRSLLRPTNLSLGDYR